MSSLIEDVEAFLDRTKMAPSAFGQQALGDRHFVRQLRKGRRVWSETENKVRRFMDREHVAEDAPLPAPAETGNNHAISTQAVA